MKFFRKRRKVQLTLSEEDNERVRRIQREIKEEKYEDAMKLVVTHIENSRGKDAYAEARYNELASSILVKQHGKEMVRQRALYGRGMLKSEYNQARAYLNRSLELYQSMGKSGAQQLHVAIILLQMANLAQIVGKYEEGSSECQKSLDLFRMYGQKELMKQATHTKYDLEISKLLSRIQETLRHCPKCYKRLGLKLDGDNVSALSCKGCEFTMDLNKSNRVYKVAKTAEEANQLVEAGFKFRDEIDGYNLFSKFVENREAFRDKDSSPH